MTKSELANLIVEFATGMALKILKNFADGVQRLSCRKCMTTGQHQKPNIWIIFTKIDIHNKREVFGLLFFCCFVCKVKCDIIML